MVRSLLHFAVYWLITIFAAIICALLALWPSRAPLAVGLHLYGKAQVLVLYWIAGIRVEVRGRQRLPDEPLIIAAKHQSWGDGFVMVDQFPGLAFIAGDHLLKFPLVGWILHRIGAIVLSNQGGAAERERMDKALQGLKRSRRPLLIYPEGHLAAPGQSHRYRKGVFHLYDTLKRPCVPVATNLGLSWDRRSFKKRPGRVTVEFLDPIGPGLSKEDFMAKLETVIEARTNALIREARA
ncbi:1-acyl-sn-glycerol-3-phosphate acyltransferase [Alkalicaulis satelles]|uniref:1-acyl-sn-glycerol-3-phosphate acyltransferase n=1 Tax=Alkalicaulis satelles TaxID=2609175 RepID=A0A5M6ZLA4_9PROT|nr:lysophospholipid acyltransferase family protein [Alkalicaulis satelles]KAA5804735.1 1-acyl-sn-glycerol-3-phosphate acyltransferase [Alkalicaulis satelles]